MGIRAQGCSSEVSEEKHLVVKKLIVTIEAIHHPEEITEANMVEDTEVDLVVTDKVVTMATGYPLGAL